MILFADSDITNYMYRHVGLVFFHSISYVIIILSLSILVDKLGRLIYIAGNSGDEIEPCIHFVV